MKKVGYALLIFTISLSFLLSGCRLEFETTYDTVVVGSSISGMKSAIELQKQGKKVLVIEASGILGENARVDANGVSVVNTAAGDTAEQFAMDMKQNNQGIDNFYTAHVAQASSQVGAWMQEMGINFMTTVRMPGHSTARTLVANNAKHTGKAIATHLEDQLEQRMIDVARETKINTITQENGLYSITTVSDTMTSNVRAKTIILAEDTKQAMTATIPLTTENQNVSNTGEISFGLEDKIELMQQLKADYNKTGEFQLAATYNTPSAQEIPAILRTYGAILINKEGSRFVNEMSDSKTISDAILKQTGAEAYLLMDNVIYEQLPYMNDYYQKDALVTDPTVTSFADRLATDETSLRTTLAQYHQMVQSGNDSEFSRSLEVNKAIFGQLNMEKGQLYALKVQPVLGISASYAEVSEKFELMNNGVPIPGLYAAGDSVRGIKLSNMLAGTEMLSGLVMGQDVSQHVLQYLNK